MMELDDVMRLVIKPGLTLLPSHLNSPEAVALLLAIGLQESRFKARRQDNDGPARGFYQFECRGGVAGVLQHRQTGKMIREALGRLEYDFDDPETCHATIENNDALATAFARLLLWTLPDSLPASDEIDLSWSQYFRAWRPGRPHRATWDGFYTKAWDFVLRSPIPLKTY